MDQFLAGHPYFVTFITIILTLVGKKVWEVWLSKSSRVTPEGCKFLQEQCRAGMLGEFQKFKFEAKNLATIQETKFLVGDDNFKNLGIRLDRTNSLLKALLQVQMEFCRKTPGIDCEDITGILIEQGIEAASLDFRKRAK